jgi:hypothetical protein
MIARTLPTILMFWHGPPLSRMERLSMTSFLRNGHPVHLYVYEEPGGVPEGVRLMNAADILPRSDLFFHKKRNSIAHFADWFRYELLYARGGLWSDTDMVCLAPFEFTSPFVFAWQDAQHVNNAVLGLPKGDALAKWMADSCRYPNRVLPYDDMKTRLHKMKRWVKGRGREYVRWGNTGPYGLTAAARHLGGYIEHALPRDVFYLVTYENHRVLFESAPLSLSGSRAVHFWNQIIEDGRSVDKNDRFPPDSPFEQLWARYMTP